MWRCGTGCLWGMVVRSHCCGVREAGCKAPRGEGGGEGGGGLAPAAVRGCVQNGRSRAARLQDFCCGLLATPQGSALLLEQGAPCADIAAVLAPPEPPASGDAAADTSPESLLSEKLRYVVQAHAAWTAVTAAPLGSGDAQHAAHALLSAATQDRHMCQVPPPPPLSIRLLLTITRSCNVLHAHASGT